MTFMPEALVPAFADELVAVEARIRPGPIEDVQRFADLVRVQRVVAVEEQRIGPSRRREAKVPRRARAAVLGAFDQGHRRVAARVVAQGRDGAVARAIVDDDHFRPEAGELVDLARQMRDMVFHVVDRNDDAEPLVRHGGALPRRRFAPLLHGVTPPGVPRAISPLAMSRATAQSSPAAAPR
ncbi:MAG: hypothetical protein R3D59_06230 [Paracoccaceae bacterium]